MKKASGKQLIIIIPVIIFAVTYAGWKIYEFTGVYREMEEFVSDAGEFIGETAGYWREYESKPAEFHEQFSYACDNLLSTYAGYTNYPYNIPVENNPVIPEIILLTSPQSIKVWSRDHISVNIGQFRDAEDMGFSITWIKAPAGHSGNLYLGGTAGAGGGNPVYSR